MGEVTYNREWDIPLGSANEWLRVRLNVERGQVNRFVIQYETVIGDMFHPVVRYDCAHGFPHRDILDHRGDLLEKKPLAEQINLNAAFQEAMDEIKTEWRTFRAAFGDRMEEGRMR